MSDICITPGAESYMSEALGQLRYTMNDRSQDVRKTFYDVLQNWMTKMEISSLRLNEKHFILYLLNGLSDDCEEINNQCKDFLEIHGERMKDALQALGEGDEEENADMKSEDKSTE